MFPTGEFITDVGGGLDGIYHQDDRALWVDGIASHDEMPAAGKTFVVYDTPVPALRFPIADGDMFSAAGSTTTGIIDGLPFVGSDTFSVAVKASGRLDVPYVQFSPALEVQTSVVRKAGTVSVTKHTTSYLFECFGEVARAESNVNEPAADFTTAATLRRFALGE